ncbi:hypothetical protein ABVK25_012525 [Lepraria finkii]|uniref:Uncharacterized protein n=1 Tax=Lepraria finkii TaxID=1340010 RepID=A0ABR4ACY5_9LECA
MIEAIKHSPEPMEIKNEAKKKGNLWVSLVISLRGEETKRAEAAGAEGGASSKFKQKDAQAPLSLT